MKKEIIKCDKCKKEIERESGEYFEIDRMMCEGWTYGTSNYWPRMKWQVCKKCIDILNLIK